MTFDELKIELRNRARAYGMCEEYHTMKIATTYEELLLATLPLFMYGWKAGIAADDMLDEFVGNINLEEYGVYYNYGGGMPPDPVYPQAYYTGWQLWIINGEVNFNKGDSLKYKAIVVGETNTTIHTNNNTYVNLEAYGVENLTMQSDDDSIIQSKLYNCIATISLNQWSEQDINADGNTQCDIEINTKNYPFLKYTGEKNSLSQVNLESSNERIFALLYNNAQLNYTEV